MTSRAPIPRRSTSSRRSRGDSGFRSPTCRRLRRRPSRSCPNGGRDAFTSFRCRRRSTSSSSPRRIRWTWIASAPWASRPVATCASRSPTAEDDRRADRGGVSDVKARRASRSRCSRCSTWTTMSRARRRCRARRTAGRRSRTWSTSCSPRGIAARASDIHIEPEEQGIAVRHRVDGVLALGANAAARRRAGARVADQDSLGARHRRSAAATGWTRARRGERRRRRSTRLDAPGVARREGRHPRARRTVDRAHARRHGFSSRRAGAHRATAAMRAKG